MRALVIRCKPGTLGKSEYLIRERGGSDTIAGPFPDAASASRAGRPLAELHRVELWLEDRDDRGRDLPPRRLWPTADSGAFTVTAVRSPK